MSASGRYEVICYPLYYAVQDMWDKHHKAVYTTKDRVKARRKAKVFNNQARAILAKHRSQS